MPMDETEGSERIHPVPDRDEGFRQSQPRVFFSVEGGHSDRHPSHRRARTRDCYIRTRIPLWQVESGSGGQGRRSGMAAVTVFGSARERPSTARYSGIIVCLAMPPPKNQPRTVKRPTLKPFKESRMSPIIHLLARQIIQALLFLLLPVLAAAARAERDTLRLKNGSVLVGEVVSADADSTVFRHPSLGLLRVPTSELAVPGTAVPDVAAPSTMRMDRRGTRSIDPADHALFFLPTGFTPPQGSFLFRDFELLFLTLGFAPTSSSTVTGGFMFPVTAEFQLLTAGIKQRLFADLENRYAVAFAGNITKPIGENVEGEFITTSNLVASYRGPNPELNAWDGFGVHAAVGYLGASDDEGDWADAFSFGMGAEVRISRNAKFMAEFLSAAPFDPEADVDGGLLTLGIRLHGDRLSADIAGLRPMVEGESMDLVFFPLLVVSYRI